jgi:PIN domain nuclease of toxin-antitoxin system
VTASAAGDPERISLLLDTHVLIWLMFGEPMLGPKAKKAIALASLESRLLVSAITPREIGMLASKKRINLYRDVLDWVRSALSMPGVGLTPLSLDVGVGSNQLPFEMHSDPADRILVATARHLGATLVTADRALLAIAKGGHFRAMDAAS